MCASGGTVFLARDEREGAYCHHGTSTYTDTVHHIDVHAVVVGVAAAISAAIYMLQVTFTFTTSSIGLVVQ